MTSTLRRTASTLVACLALASTAAAQKRGVQEPPPAAKPRPVVQYILVGILLVIPIGLVCRSSRR